MLHRANIRHVHIIEGLECESGTEGCRTNFIWNKRTFSPVKPVVGKANTRHHVDRSLNRKISNCRRSWSAYTHNKSYERSKRIYLSLLYMATACAERLAGIPVTPSAIGFREPLSRAEPSAHRGIMRNRLGGYQCASVTFHS